MVRENALSQSSQQRRGATRWLVRETLGNLMLIGILLGTAGSWDWWMGWALSAVYILWTLATAILILPVNTAMLAERSRPHPDQRRWDKALIAALGICMVAEYIVAGQDERFGWSPPFPLALQSLGPLAAIAGYDILLVWAMAANSFFVATVRIQTERHHKVVSDGPYRFVRHPGYLGTLVLHLGVPFMLSSLWALIPALLLCVVLVARTAFEDKTPQAELPGYTDYAREVRFRLLPAVW